MENNVKSNIDKLKEFIRNHVTPSKQRYNSHNKKQQKFTACIITSVEEKKTSKDIIFPH